MTQINWGITQGGNSFQNALSQGLQLGSHIRQRTEEKERKNALAQYAANPSEEGIAGLAQAAPEYAIQERQRYQQQAQQQRLSDIKARAAQGDPGAMAELAGVDIDVWRGLNADQRKDADEQTTAFANAAMDILSKPPAMREQAYESYIQQFSQRYPEMAQYSGQYSEEKLRSVIAQSDMIGKLHAMEAPDYQAVAAGETLVNTRDPAAVQQFGQQQPPAKQVGGATYYQNPETGQWYDNPQEAMGGSGGNATGGFPGR